ncbi:MAG: cellulase family glycosylhydrolase [Candidatus Omnitrophica bacterium]|nr:cellulase family glycosylhydrolase [Candidatus Omnitrophota bacterium]MDD5487714.1 cellulase family glycosylhydrolase [Candidatus Omnitrophota bacterium]
MSKRPIKTILVFLLVCSFVCCRHARAEAAEIAFAGKVPGEAVCYETVKVRFILPYIKGNPDDIADMDAYAVIIGPDRETISMPAYSVYNDKNKNMSVWEVRFTPTRSGEYKYYVKVRSSAVSGNTPAHDLLVGPGSGDGFLRRASGNDHYLVFDSGRPFFGIGHNVAWVNKGSTKLFERYFTELENNGCNMARVWMCNWSFPLEWGDLGRYDKEAAEALDRLLDLAAQKGIYLILCLDTYGSLMSGEGGWDEDKWGANPYNVCRGGPCRTPEDFFKDPDAIRFYKNKLRYIVARYGHSPNILAFELWNEYNAPVEWLEEMTVYLRSINPHRQLITTSLGYPHRPGKKAAGKVWDLKRMDIVSEHLYSNDAGPDYSRVMINEGRTGLSGYSKPFIFAEFGMDASRDDKFIDPDGKGTALHNSIWASLVSGAMGTAMNWWWDSYIRPKKLYHHYKGLSLILSGLDWNGPFKYIVTSGVMRPYEVARNTSPRDVEISTRNEWGEIGPNRFFVSRDGSLSGTGNPNKYLHGTDKMSIKKDMIFDYDGSRPGKAVINIGKVSQDAELVVLIDGKEVLKKRLPTGPGEGPWKKSRYKEEWDLYQCEYDMDIDVPLPRGRHTLTLSNKGGDWVSIEKVTFKGYVDSIYENAMCAGIQVGGKMLFWVKNNAVSMPTDTVGRIEGAFFDVMDLTGRYDYNVEWYDTVSGKAVSSCVATPYRGKLRLEVPPFDTDIACIVSPKEVE